MRLPAANPLTQLPVLAANPLPQSPVPRTQPQSQPQALIKTHTQPLISSFYHSPTTRLYLLGKDPPSAKDLSIVEKLLPLQLAMDHTYVASKTSATSTSALMETRSPGMVKFRRRVEMYGTEPSRCKRRQLFLLVSIVADQICHDSRKLGFFQVLIDRKINCKDLCDGIYSFNDAKWKEQRPCRIVRLISKGFRISMDKRDQPMDTVFLDELRSRIAYKSNRSKVVMSPKNCETIRKGGQRRRVRPVSN
ncbi:hypothetical protein NE237_019161 [Protea cynaroides]|uniref:Uncharacterized protein n=1 Tax=Protea cynaroides TaxID=273540 RepID=A0A9Q0KBB9_9MAGN|nr:hypothetical protein NE237_019161 [Protea cynaroides]